MPKSARYTLVWSASRQAYELRERQEGVQDIIHEGLTWLAWANQLSSFSFHGRYGSYSACKENTRHQKIDRTASRQNKPLFINLASDPLLATKIHFPQPRPQLVHRPRLTHKREQGLNLSLTLISALEKDSSSNKDVEIQEKWT